MLGTPLMPWQRLVADVGFEFDPETLLPCYREVIVSVPRQNGKTTLMLSIEGERCLVWLEPQRVIYTAQTGTDARTKLLDDQVPILEARIPQHIKRVYRAKGEEAVRFRNGSSIELAASSEESGHGSTVDLGVLDELWADEDNRREQAILPMMNTRPRAQMLVCSTKGTAKSVFFNRKIELGRAAAAADRGHGVAYFEWSIPRGEDIENPEIWWENMPALGWTITPQVVQHACENMDEPEFRRAFCNQTNEGSHDRLIPITLWRAVQQAGAEVPMDRPRIGLDVLPDRTAASLVASDGVTVEVIDHRPGTGWVVERVKDLVSRRGATIAIDGGGPAVSLADDLEGEGIRVDRMQPAHYIAACARIYDAIADRTVSFRPDAAMDDAVEYLERRPIGDRFAWDRQKSRSDITPFVAATIAYARDKGGGFPVLLGGE